ncbi:MAG: hypothetical protein ABEJ71_01525 [Halodesulfurarchaeum sp.]
MICVLSLIVFSILGIFSASHRELAREAFHCVFQQATLRPCETGFDQRMKTEVTARLMRFPRLARFWRAHFQAISWLFVLLFLASFAYSVQAVYNLAVHGSCTPGAGCVLTGQPGNLTLNGTA